MFKKVFAWLAGLAILVSPFVLAWQRQNIIDWWRLRDYHPNLEVADLSESTTMTDLGRRLFYVHKPELKDKSSFGLSCPSNGAREQTIVLGCYITHRNIYIFDVIDERLQGIEEVTAAHEMLHAAYDRLSNQERERIDRLTADAFASLSDERIKTTVESYRTRDASSVPNELHSILGTEVRNLPEELETYYKKYFADRSRTVAFSEKYEAEFTTRKAAIAAYDQQLDQLRQEIDGLEQDIRLQNEFLQSEQNRLNALRNSNPEAYNQAVPGYNQSVQAYNADVNQLRGKVAEYNAIVVARNQIASEEQELIDAINSSLPTL